MIANIKAFEKKLIDNDLNRTKLAKKRGMSSATLSSKLDKPKSDFKLCEMVEISNELKLNQEEFIDIFFGTKTFV